MYTQGGHSGAKPRRITFLCLQISHLPGARARVSVGEMTREDETQWQGADTGDGDETEARTRRRRGAGACRREQRRPGRLRCSNSRCPGWDRRARRQSRPACRLAEAGRPAVGSTTGTEQSRRRRRREERSRRDSLRRDQGWRTGRAGRAAASGSGHFRDSKERRSDDAIAAGKFRCQQVTTSAKVRPRGQPIGAARVYCSPPWLSLTPGRPARTTGSEPYCVIEPVEDDTRVPAHDPLPQTVVSLDAELSTTHNPPPLSGCGISVHRSCLSGPAWACAKRHFSSSWLGRPSASNCRLFLRRLPTSRQGLPWASRFLRAERRPR